MENSIETLNLDVRAYNYFKREGITTVEEMREHIRTKRDHAPKFCAEGEKALAEYDKSREIVIEPDDYKRALTVTRNIKVNAEIMEQSLYEVCKGLAEVKRDKLYKPMGYQTFENYCEVEIGIKRRQASKYALIGENLSFENAQSTAQIGTEKLYLLAQLSEPAREEIMQNTDLESTSVKELKAKIKELEDNAKADKELLTRQIKSKTEMRESRNRAEEKVRELEQQLQELKEKPAQGAVVKELEEKISDLKKNNDKLMSKVEEAEKEAEKCRKSEATACGKLGILQTDSDMLKIKNEQLEKQLQELKEHPVQVTVEDTTKIQELEEQLRQEKERQTEKITDIYEIYRIISRNIEDAFEDLCEFMYDYENHPDIAKLKAEIREDIAGYVRDAEQYIGKSEQ